MTRDELLRLADRVTDRDWCSDDIAALARHCAEQTICEDELAQARRERDEAKRQQAADSRSVAAHQKRIDELREERDQSIKRWVIATSRAIDAESLLTDALRIGLAECERIKLEGTAWCEEAAALAVREMTETLAHTEAERDAALARVRELEEWVTRKVDMTRGDRDHACERCWPGGDIVIPGFRCVPHSITQPARLDADVLPPIDANDERIVDGMVAAKTNAMGTRTLGGGANGHPPIPPPGSGFSSPLVSLEFDRDMFRHALRRAYNAGLERAAVECERSSFVDSGATYAKRIRALKGGAK